MGVMLSAGGSLRWYRDALCEPERREAAATGGDAYDLMTHAATRAPAGCEGLLFLPYLSGERTPHVDPHARGVFFGLTLRHEKAHLTRAVIEGVSFGLRDSLELVRQQGIAVRDVRISGGGARSGLWRQILADVINADVVTVNVTQGAAYGAAVLAGVAAGVYPDVQSACDTLVRETGRTRPGPDLATYAACYPRYRSLYVALRDQFRAI
jgi:xylulokinase